MAGLFEGYDIDLKKADEKKLVKKSKVEKAPVDVKKVLKSKATSLDDKLKIIEDKVYSTLGKQKDSVVVIRTAADYNSYIDRAIQSGRVAVDTETDNSLDPVTCRLMGLCLYVEGEKQAYIPVNHVDPATGGRLPDQLTEGDVAEGLRRLGDTRVVMHNGKFDYEVLKCTCGVDVLPWWDTMVAARLIDENSPAGLKYLYTKFIDPEQERYDIEELFTGVLYAQVKPEVFALYAATDSMMTDRLYELQYSYFFDGGKLRKENERLYWVFRNIEMPLVEVTAAMELNGIAVDIPYTVRLKDKYQRKLEDVDARIAEELERLKPRIDRWRLSPEANSKTRTYVPARTKMSRDRIEAAYPEVDEDGRRYKVSKARSDMLDDPVNMSSPAQLAILLYDVLKVEQVSKKSPRGTGEDELNAILEKRPDLKICSLLLERRGLMKLITAFIDPLLKLVEHWPDGRVRAHQNQLGTETGRYSSGGKIKFVQDGQQVTESGINTQQVPSSNPDIRLCYRASYERGEVEAVEDGSFRTFSFTVPEYEEVETDRGFMFCRDLRPGDTLKTDEGDREILSIVSRGREWVLSV